MGVRPFVTQNDNLEAKPGGAAFAGGGRTEKDRVYRDARALRTLGDLVTDRRQRVHILTLTCLPS